jgi:NAD+ synthase
MLKLTKEALAIDLPTVTTRIKRFIKDYAEKTKAKGIVIGLSGGIDSSVSGALAALAIGGDKISALNMPEEENLSEKDIRDAKIVAKKFGFKLEIIDISPILEGYYKTLPIYDENDKLSRGNIKARTRMVCLYYYSNSRGKIVCGSSDKSETMMGYFTKWGDVAADISPLMDLYKTQVRQLAAYIGIPKEIIAKPPSPQLWLGQTAEKEIGVKYEVLDLILLGLENFMLPEEIAHQLRLPTKIVQDVKDTWLAREHKRRLPLTIKLEYRTVGADFRIPYTRA